MIDFCLTTDAPILEHDVDMVLQRIDMLFDTDYHEVLGDNIYGSDYRKYLYNLTASNAAIEDYTLRNIIDNVDLMGFSVDVSVNILLGSQNDIILITINLSKEGDMYEKTYNISQ